MSADSAIVVEGVNHHFGRGALRKQILHGIDVTIDRGEIVIVTGPSGSGKTTLLTLVGALRSTQEGSLQVLGKELQGARSGLLEDVRRKIGFIFQRHNLLEAVTAVENVELGLRVTRRFSAGEVRQRAIATLKAVGLEDRLHYKPEQLSGGQRQRVAIARALAAEPPMVLADEPTASLDKASGREVVDHMNRLAREQGTTILLVTHDNRILDVADRIIHLEDGRLSSFSESVLDTNERMMDLMADSYRNSNVGALVDSLDEDDFARMVEEMSTEARRFAEATALANDRAFSSMLEQCLFAFTRKLARLVEADRASLFLVDRASGTLQLRVTEELPVDEDIRVPIDKGIVGDVVARGEIVNVADAYDDPRFNPAVDKQFGYRTRSVLALPIHDDEGNVFAVAQLLNRHTGGPFTDADAARVDPLLRSMGVMLAGWRQASEVPHGD